MLPIQTKTSLYRDFALMSLMIVFVLVIASVWVVYETYEDHSEKVIRQLENESVRIDRALIVEIENAAYLLESLGRQLSNGGTDNLAAVGQLLKSFDADSYAKNNILSWVKADQTIQVSSNKGMLTKPVDVSDRDYMKKAIAQPWQVHIGRPVLGRVSERRVIPIGMGITDFTGRYLGAIVISIDINTFTRRIRAQIKDNAISFAIANQNLTLLAQVAEDKDFYARHFEPARLDSLLVEAKPSGVYSRATLFDTNTIYAYYEISSQYPYIILLGYDQALNKLAIAKILWPRLLQLLVIVFFLLFVLWVVRTRVINPVVELSEQAKAIILGEHDNTHKRTYGPAEIEQLAYQLRRLAQYVAERHRIENEIVHKNKALLRIKESAQLTNEVKAEFLEQIAETIEEPAAYIRESADTIRKQIHGQIGNIKYLEQAEEMYQRSHEMLQMIAEIRQISAAETGLLALNEALIDIPFVIQKCLRIFHNKAGHQDIKIQLHIDDTLPKLYGDELRIKQILLNILSAAAAQIQGGDHITLEALVLKGEFIFQLTFLPNQPQDMMHMGIPVFTPGSHMYTSADDRETRHTIGLGIILTKLLIALHEGTLNIRNRPKRGTVITIKFPEKRVHE